MANESGCNRNLSLNRRSFLGLGAGAVAAGVSGVATAQAGQPDAGKIVSPPAGKKILLATKLSMIAGEVEGKKLSLAERLRMAGDAGFDGVDFDEAGGYTPEQARDAVRESGVFVHNAINHDHWKMRLTSAKQEERDQGRKNIEHCIRVSHAAGGSAVLIVLGQGGDGSTEEIEERARQEIRKMLPLAGSLGQMILVENVWNKMMYDHDKGPEQTPERFIKFIDSLNSPWVGMYYDVGNHWKYGQPGDWIRAFGRRCVKMDAKGYSRAKNNWTELTGPDDDLPWADVRKALAEIDFNGWATAEVGGGDVKRLTTVREEMQKAFLG
ncbi:MAG: sugar phosphate isomerase/epimerase family protein [Phycisphaerales bacterium]